MESAPAKYRSWAATLANTVPTAFFLLVGVLIVVVGEDLFIRALLAVTVVCLGPLWLRMFMAPVRLTHTNLTYRRFWRYHSIPLANVVRAGTGPTDFGLLPWRALLVDTTSGPVTVGELASLGPFGRRSVAHAVGAINRASMEAQASVSIQS